MNFLDVALAYAACRWCWDDETHIRELLETHPPEGFSPAEWIDYLAWKYDLTDPEEFM